jgi:hypothetical protein
MRIDQKGDSARPAARAVTRAFEFPGHAASTANTACEERAARTRQEQFEQKQACFLSCRCLSSVLDISSPS